MRNGLVAALLPAPNTAPPAYESDQNGSLLPPQNALERPLGALRRYKWLILGIVFLSALVGFAGSRLVKAKYEAHSTIWIAAETPEVRATGPIRSRELLQSGAWIELLRSYRIVDEVVRKLTLYLTPMNPAQRPYFAGFALGDRFVPGSYELNIDRAKQTWALRIKADKTRPEGMISGEEGAAADSVGRKFGFQWVLPASAFAGVGTATVPFNVSTPRETSIRIADQLGNRLIAGSNFLWLTYTDPDPRIAAQTLNTWADEYVRVAAELKKRKMVEFANILEGQLQYAENATRDAEAAYQNFRVNAITLPTEGGPVAAGLVGERDPALTSYFDQKIQYDNLRHDREALESNMANAARNGAPYEGLLLIPSVAQSPGAEGLREAFRTRYQLQARLAAERQHFTDEYATVKELKASLETLEKRTIPQLGYQLLAQMREREADYQRRIQSASRELQSIPPRTIEEHRLSRAVVVSEGLYTNLRSRYAEAKLAEASATPDISVLDTAVVPVRPTKKTTATVIILMAILAGLGAAGGLALLLDKLDGKFRYAHQAVSELGLVIAGAVPRIPKRGVGTTNPEQVVQFLESFRAMRLHIAHTARGDRLRLAVTSAAPGDGKSLISSNLALSYSEAGLRTVLVDADTRRGSLHKTFGLKGKGGLTEYLLGKIPDSLLLKATSHKNLSFISCGQRNGINPELLASGKLKGLIDHLAQQFDVVIVDTPPLAAGIDAYAISAATGNILMVVRMGHTERRLATAKLALLDRLPVYVLGSVMNDVPAHGDFQYYTAYSAAYALDEGPSTADLVEIGAQ